MKKYLIIFVMMCFVKVSADEKFRIKELIPPTWLAYPAVEPAIPDNYVAGTPDKNFEYASIVFWGEKDDIDRLLKNREAPTKNPVFQVKHSADVYQNGPDSFFGENLIVQNMKSIGMINPKMQKLMWGDYPVLALECEFDGKKIRMAWVGLNYGGGMTMVVCMFPTAENNAETVWENFLTKTKQLEESKLFVAKGMDMQDGYTNYKTGTAALQVKAEKRIHDKKLAVLVTPTNDNTTFVLSDIYEAQMGSKWKYGEPCVKVSGQITEKNGKTTNFIDAVVTVLPKNVEEFSFDLNKEKHPGNVVVFAMDGE